MCSMRCKKIITNITGPIIKGSTKKEEPLPGRVKNLPENEESQKPKNSISQRRVQSAMPNITEWSRKIKPEQGPYDSV